MNLFVLKEFQFFFFFEEEKRSIDSTMILVKKTLMYVS